MKDEYSIDPKGVGLRISEWQEIEKRAKAFGMTRHELAVKLLRYGLKELRSGKIKTKTEMREVTKLDL